MTMRIIAGVFGGEFLLYLFCCMCAEGFKDGAKFQAVLHVIAAFIGTVVLAAYAVEFSFTGSWGNW